MGRRVVPSTGPAVLQRPVGHAAGDSRPVVAPAQDLVGHGILQQLLEDAVAYEVLCRRHHRTGITRRVADGALQHSGTG